MKDFKSRKKNEKHKKKMKKFNKKFFIILAVCICVIVLCISNYKNILKKIYKTDYSQYVEKYSYENNVDPLLVYSIIKAESNFDEGALSNKGATGLMQLMDETAKEVANNEVMEYESGSTLYNAEENIKIGIIYFSQLLNSFKNLNLALAAYNAGYGNVKAWIEKGIIKDDGSDIENIPFKETNMYVRKILRDYKIYKKLYS